MTYAQFKEHLKKHGVTKARTTQEFRTVPAGTELLFASYEEGISSYDEDTGNTEEYNFDHQWAWNNYLGEFILVDPGFPYDDYPFDIKVGDLVDISPNMKNHPHFAWWQEKKQEMAGACGLEVRWSSFAEYIVYTEDKSEWFYIPCIYVRKHIPKPEETVEMTVAEIEKKLGVKNLKIVKE